MTTVSVIVPSYRRPELLRDCLRGLAEQTRPADEVVVVRRREDAATADVIALAPLNVRDVVVDEAGILAALRCGARAATSEVLAFTDDDAVPRPQWLATLLPHYDDETVGAVGGRDVLHPALPHGPLPSALVGRISPWGKLYGFHHVGEGPPADVEVLKGVNMSYRAAALGLPAAMRGSGAEVHNEIIMGLWARSRGWRLRYDPAALVDHYTGPRFDADQRVKPRAVAIENEAYNLVVAVLGFRPQLFWRRALYGLALGDQASPGAGRAVVALVRRDTDTLRRTVPSLRGQLRALLQVRRGRRFDVVPVVDDVGQRG